MNFSGGTRLANHQAQLYLGWAGVGWVHTPTKPTYTTQTLSMTKKKERVRSNPRYLRTPSKQKKKKQLRGALSLDIYQVREAPQFAVVTIIHGDQIEY
jgi:hypothetical protein